MGDQDTFKCAPKQGGPCWIFPRGLYSTRRAWYPRYRILCHEDHRDLLWHVCVRLWRLHWKNANGLKLRFNFHIYRFFAAKAIRKGAGLVRRLFSLKSRSKDSVDTLTGAGGNW